MKTDPRPFIAAAVSGMAARPIHGQLAQDPKNPKGPQIVVGVADAAHLGERAVELGVATALAFDRWEEAQVQIELEAEEAEAKAEEARKASKKAAAEAKRKAAELADPKATPPAPES